MKIDVKADVKAATKYLNHMSKQIKFATKDALNDTASKVRDMEMMEILHKVDRPTQHTIEGYAVVRANTARLSAIVELKRNTQYLAGLITGGGESSKHQVIGKRAKSNAYGNLPRRATKGAKTFSATIKGQPGVWKRSGGKRNPKIHLVAHFPGSRSYKKTLDFYGIAERTSAQWFPNFIRKRVAYEIKTAR